MRWRVVIDSGYQPVTVAEVKTHCGITDTAFDTYLAALIPAAVQYVERRTSRVLTAKTLEGYADAWPSSGYFELSPFPVRSITELKYYDTSDAVQTVPSTYYYLDTFSEPPRVVLTSGYSWGWATRPQNALYVKWAAGYATQDGDASAVPAPLLHCVKLLTAHWFEQREPISVGTAAVDIPYMISSLLFPFTPIASVLG